MTRRPVTWVAWAWLALLGLMLLIPLVGILIDQAAAITALVIPVLIGMLLGAAGLAIWIPYRKQSWALPVVLGTWGLFLVLYHRQMGLLLAGGVLGCIVGYFRAPLARVTLRLWASLQRWRKRRAERLK